MAYVGVTPEVSNKLYHSHRRYVSTVRRSAARTLSRIAAGTSLFSIAGLAVDAARTIYVGTKRALDFSSNEDFVTKRSRTMTVSVGTEQRKRVRAETGKKLSKTDKKLKIIGAHLQTYVDRFQGLGNTLLDTGEGRPGWYGGNYYHNQSITPGNAILPYYLMDLTCAHRNRAEKADGTNQGGYYGVPLMRLVRDNSSQAYQWYAQTGRTCDNDKDVYKWSTEQTPLIQTEFNMPGDKAFIDWVDIRMNVFGATKCPVTAYVQLIQFKEEDFCPGVYGSQFTGPDEIVYTLENDASALSSTDRDAWNRWQNFWLSETDKLLGNPLSKRGLDKFKAYDVLFSRTFEFNPADKDDEDSTPNMCEFHLRYNMDKVISYIRNPRGQSDITITEIANANEWDVHDANKTSVACNPKGRVYLKIAFQTPKNIWTAEGDLTDSHWAGSFDLMVRRKHNVLRIGS